MESNLGVEWKNLALYIGKPIENQERMCFSTSSSSKTLCGNEIGICSSSKYLPVSDSHESTKGGAVVDSLRKVFPFEATYEDIFTGGTFSSSGNCSLMLGRSKEYGSSRSSPHPDSSTPSKRSRASYHHIQNPCCQVEGCNLDLKSAKDYHRRHRICEVHSKSPKVIVAGMERRFCQQCSRFHELSEFDDKKRSCRRRLSDHNARRRRVQPESFQLKTPALSSALYSDQRLHQSILLNGFSIPQTSGFDASICFPPADDFRLMDSSQNIISDQYDNNNVVVGAHSLLSSSSSSNNHSWAGVLLNNNNNYNLDSDSQHQISSSSSSSTLFHQPRSDVMPTPVVSFRSLDHDAFFDSGGLFYSG